MARSVVYLVRHAKAGERRVWDGDDLERPLSKAGWKQAHALGKRLQKKGATELVSSPYLRCMQTLEPLATCPRRLPVLADERLLEGAGFEGALELLAEVGRRRGPVQPRRRDPRDAAGARPTRHGGQDALPTGARAPSGCSSATMAGSPAAPSGHRRPDAANVAARCLTPASGSAWQRRGCRPRTPRSGRRCRSADCSTRTSRRTATPRPRRRGTRTR